MIAVHLNHYGFWIGGVLAVGGAGDSKDARQIVQHINLPSAY